MKIIPALIAIFINLLISKIKKSIFIKLGREEIKKIKEHKISDFKMKIRKD